VFSGAAWLDAAAAGAGVSGSVFPVRVSGWSHQVVTAFTPHSAEPVAGSIRIRQVATLSQYIHEKSFMQFFP
jgi:hypothetical protein